KERDRANREAETSRRVAEFMTNMFKVSDPSEARGNSVTARELLDKASREIDAGLAKNPELQAQMMDVMGTVYRSVGLSSVARPMLERSAEIRLHVLGPEDPATLLSRHHLCVVLDDQGDFAEAEKLERDTLDMRRRILGPEHPDTLRTMKNLASTMEREARDMPNGPEADARLAEAEKLERETLDICQRVLGREHQDTLAVMNNIGSTLDYEGRYTEAEQLHRETFAIQRRILGPEHRDTMASMCNIAFTLEKERRYAEAEKIYREGLEIQRRVLGPEHPDTLLTMDNLNNTLEEQGRYSEAEKLCRETLATRIPVLGSDHRVPPTSRFELAGLLARQGRPDEALLYLRQAVDHNLDSATDFELESQEDFKSLHGDPRFTALVAHAKARAAQLKEPGN